MIRALLSCLFLTFAANATHADAPRLSIDITELPSEPFETAVAMVKQAGADVTSLSLFWDDLEDAGGVYAPAFDWPSLANAYYPSEGMAVSLTFSVIDTVADRRRVDLRALQWDDPELLKAATTHFENVLSRMQSVEITAIAIGNEVDGYLSSNAEIIAFATFLGNARRVIHQIRPGVPVGTKITHAALSQNRRLWSPLLARSDAVMLTYYPLDGFSVVKSAERIERDLSRMVDLAGKMPLYLLETGYPSAGCGGSPDGQLAFVKRVLKLGEDNPDTLRLISLTWLNDISLPEVEAYAGYYGIDLACFSQYLGSLGLRDRDGAAKPAMDWLLAR